MLDFEIMGQEGLMVNKGKRTKRSTRMALTSGDEEVEEDRRSYGSVVTEEEHDMANCLILLASGGDQKSKAEEKQTDVGIGTKRKVAEMDGGRGCYECKTCNKTFSSFQALGGHRTSHRKVKPDISVSGSNSDDVAVLSSSNCSISLQVSVPSTKTKNVAVSGLKVHQCSICGSEFSSGQALGGHMRRHRPIIRSQCAPVSSMGSGATEHQLSSAVEVGEVKTRSLLSLDLNLPAPEDGETCQQNAAFQNREATHLVVGCHC